LGAIYLPSGQKWEGEEKSWVGPRVQVLRETREPEPGIQAHIDRNLGVNRFGGPLYRVVWGYNRLEWIAGLFTRFDDAGRFLREEYGDFLELKYSYLGKERINRWMVERWFAPEEYGTREMWDFETHEIEGFREFAAVGPYPGRGDYELVQVVEDLTEGLYVGLDPEIVDFLIWRCQETREIDDAKRKAMKQDDQAAKDAKLKAEIGDEWDEAAPAFQGVSNTTQANAPSRNTQKATVTDIGKYRAPSAPGMSVVPS
jgi:hypothetical protein